ncbi:MAG: hypothetical protein M9932_09860 [Xanthobacteraceae bacterium]|nr:hypothetical protein [Xanthobacteraceae bacterium]
MEKSRDRVLTATEIDEINTTHLIRTPLKPADPAFRAKAIEEWDKIEPYLRKGFIARWPE